MHPCPGGDFRLDRGRVDEPGAAMGLLSDERNARSGTRPLPPYYSHGPFAQAWSRCWKRQPEGRFRWRIVFLRGSPAGGSVYGPPERIFPEKITKAGDLGLSHLAVGPLIWGMRAGRWLGEASGDHEHPTLVAELLVVLAGTTERAEGPLP